MTVRRLDDPQPAAPALAVWQVDLDAGHEGVLSRDERERARRYADAEHGRRWAAARAALRVLLGERLGLEPEAVTFAHGPHGKPEVAGAALRFNLSHAGGVALIALADGREVGVDVERTDRRSHAVQRALTAGERAALGAGDRHLELLRVWCRKEALAKASGRGLGWAPERFDTSAPGAYALADLDPGEGYVAALAVAGAAPASITPRRLSRPSRT
jgi:4'-phosphopantetheinyl transferase